MNKIFRFNRFAYIFVEYIFKRHLHNEIVILNVYVTSISNFQDENFEVGEYLQEQN
jgi:hypothetical protein